MHDKTTDEIFDDFLKQLSILANRMGNLDLAAVKQAEDIITLKAEAREREERLEDLYQRARDRAKERREQTAILEAEKELTTHLKASLVCQIEIVRKLKKQVGEQEESLRNFGLAVIGYASHFGYASHSCLTSFSLRELERQSKQVSVTCNFKNRSLEVEIYET